jgi:hypothetical protein
MQTVADSTPSRKPLKAYRATLRDEAGTVAKLDGEILFFNDVTGDILTIDPEDCVWLCVLGEVGIAQCQAALDTMHGGAPRICISRLQEVA